MGLADVFNRGVGGGSSGATEKQLAAFVARAREPWPELRVDESEFVAHLAKLLGDSEDPVEELGSLEASDLHLAFACLQQVARAHEVFERVHGSHIKSAHHRMGTQRPPFDEFRQAVRNHAFVPRPNAPAAIATYSGRGPLGAWFRITASRVALGLIRERGREERHASSIELIAGEVVRRDPFANDPELRVLFERCQEAMREGVVRAASKLTPRQRAVLRLALSDRHSVRQIGTMYGVHHATAARWVRDAYTELVETVRADLRTSLGVSERELDSILRAVRSHLDLTLSRALSEDS